MSVRRILIIALSMLCFVSTVTACSKMNSMLGSQPGDEQKPTGGEGSGSHGGDELKHLFTEARLSVISKLRSAETLVFRKGVSKDRAYWFRQHRDDLIQDLETAPHIWSAEESLYCAQTNIQRSDAVILSVPTCRKLVWTLDAAIRILVHEATHHLGVESEEEADALAIAFAGAKPLSGVGFWEGWQRNGVPDLAKNPATTQVYVGGALVMVGNNEQAQCEESARYAVYNIWNSDWTSINSARAASARSNAALTVLGKHNKMWIWGGHCTDADGMRYLNDGAIYHPQTDTWEQVATEGAPTVRDHPYTAYLTNHVFVWGGSSGGEPLNDGAVYSLNENRWYPVAAEQGPAALAEGKYSVAAIDESSEPLTRRKIVLTNLDNAGIVSAYFYSVDQRSWQSVKSTPPPLELGDRETHLLWADSELFVFVPELIEDENKNSVAGLVWNPTRDNWRTISGTGAPHSRTHTSFVWTGARYVPDAPDQTVADFMMFGGIDALTAEVLADGAVYSPATDSWRKLNPEGAPVARYDAYAAWTGARLMIWGGRNRYMERIPVGGILTPL